ncbi:MAG: hypothetical protein V1889_01165 [archaeon]
MNYQKIFPRLVVCSFIVLYSGCSYFFSPEYQEILKEDMRALSSGDVTQESSRLLKVIENESLKEAKDKK